MPIDTNSDIRSKFDLTGNVPEETMKPISRQDLLADFEALSDNDKREVLNFVAKLKGKKLPKGTPGKNLLKFSGLFDAKSIEQIETAIEEGCEQVNPHGW